MILRLRWSFIGSTPSFVWQRPLSTEPITDAPGAHSIGKNTPTASTNFTTQAATDGTVRVGYYELASAGYYYTGSGTVTGHVELGNGYGDWPGRACKAGTAYANGSGTTLSPCDYTQYSTYDGTIVYNTEITGTWWEYSGGTDSN